MFLAFSVIFFLRNKFIYALDTNAQITDYDVLSKDVIIGDMYSIYHL